LVVVVEIVSDARAIVAGGAGFLGSHLCRELVGRGLDVVAIDDISTGDAANIRDLEGLSNFRLLKLDVSRELSVAGPVDFVFHFASPASPGDYAALPLQTLRTGSAGTDNLLRLAVQKDARFVLASTSEVYGDPLEHPQKETYFGNVDPTGPRSVYNESKRYSEALTSAYRRACGANTGIVRIFNTYGPYMRETDGRVVPSFVSSALRGAPLVVHGDGRQTRSLCYVDDLVRGVCAFAASNQPGPMNLGNPEEISVLALAQKIVDIVRSSSVVTFAARPEGDPGRRRPDIGVAARILGWHPEVSTDVGLRRTVDWFAERASRR
jgi:dTDP-glucose 4,6-dehydratase